MELMSCGYCGGYFALLSFPGPLFLQPLNIIPSLTNEQAKIATKMSVISVLPIPRLSLLSCECPSPEKPVDCDTLSSCSGSLVLQRSPPWPPSRLQQ